MDSLGLEMSNSNLPTRAHSNCGSREQVYWLSNRNHSPLQIKCSSNLFPRTVLHQGPTRAFFWELILIWRASALT